MSLFDIIKGRALMSYEADSSQWQRELDKMKRAEAERVKASVEGNKAVSQSLEDLVGVYGKVAGGVASAVGGAKMVIGILRDVANESRLSAAAQAIDLGSVNTATKGLRTEMDLLRDAAKLQAGEFKLTTEQVAAAEQAMIQLTRRGHEAEEVNRAITDAIVKLKVDALADLGIHIDKAGLSMEKEADRAEILKRVLGELGKVSLEFANTQLTAAENTEAMANRMENAIDRLKKNVGKGVAYAATGVEALATAYARQMTSGIFEIGENAAAGARQIPSAIYTDWASRGSEAARFYRQKEIDDARSAHFRGNVLPAFLGDGRFGGGLSQYADSLGELFSPVSGAFDADGKAPSGAKAAAITAAQALMRFATASNENVGGGGAFSGGGLGAAAGSNVDIFGAGVTSTLTDTINKRQTANWKAELGNRANARTSLLEQTIGPLGQFDAYKAAWDGLTSSVVAGYNAMVDGSMSFGKAFKMAIAGSLKATGAQLLIESLKETAAGVASLALGPIGGASAAAHFKAAALYGAGAIAAGAAASALGGGGAGTSAGGGAGAAAPIGGANAGARNDNRGQPIVMIIGDPYDLETNQLRRDRSARRAVERYMPTAAGGAY